MRGGRVSQAWYNRFTATNQHLTRYDVMVVEPSPDWSVFQQIFADPWEAFQHAHPRHQTSYYNGLVAKMLVATRSRWAMSNTVACSVARHPSGGDELQIVVVLAVCQSLRGQLGQPGQQDAPREGDLSAHHPDGAGHVPHDFLPERGSCVERVHALRAQCLDDFYSTVRGKALKGGSITVLHTHGRNGQYHPQGYDAQGARWSISSTCPTTSCVANGSGTSCVWCARRSRRRRSTS